MIVAALGMIYNLPVVVPKYEKMVFQQNDGSEMYAIILRENVIVTNGGF